MLNTNVTRINITIPKKIITELEKAVPNRGKSSYISAAIQEKLIRERRIEALKDLRKLPATFTNIKDSTKYITKMRKDDDKKRFKELAA
jgi:metal-responsive CopG/Arc/MetJ family transcriptional regulator